MLWVQYIIDVFPEEAARRKSKEKDRIERAGIELQTRVRKTYLELSNRFQERFVLIDGHDSIDDIHGSILAELRRRKLFL